MKAMVQKLINRKDVWRENRGTRTYLLRACRAFLLNLLRSAFKVAAEKRREPKFTRCSLSFAVFEQ